MTPSSLNPITVVSRQRTKLDTTHILRIKKKLGISDSTCNNGFLHPDGTLSVPHCTHDVAANLAGTTLEKYIKAGGCRIKNHSDTLAIECGKRLTDEQVQRISRIIRENSFGILVYQIEHIYGEVQNFRRVTVNQFIRELEK